MSDFPYFKPGFLTGFVSLLPVSPAPETRSVLEEGGWSRGLGLLSIYTMVFPPRA